MYVVQYPGSKQLKNCPNTR